MEVAIAVSKLGVGAPRSTWKQEMRPWANLEGRGGTELALLKGYYFSENSDKKNSHQCWEMRGKFIFLCQTLDKNKQKFSVSV